MDPTDPTFTTAQANEAGLVYPPTRQVCRGCHNKESPFVKAGYDFKFEERVARGTHTHLTLQYEHDG
jgi:hypothetical protein